ncbi:hypothetical protein FW774_08240 [Pedobacter sp. BS3]|uniref:hypothetical protein n=1 Tax=Pedobacter sp. BS3 TaxID=2567937 RepID=UPI0011EC8E41|nr:hypothetical protein [Pedobacter sp. BS3]TZF84947.1 hypothetical protein FW774_08240 [Pedobacter sp. BS3]
MKKLFLIILPLFLLVSACQKTEYVTPNQTILTSIPATGWVSSNGGRRYSATIDMPEIDNYIDERGGVLVYLAFGDGPYEQIPEVYDGFSYSYSYFPGQLTVDVQSSDGNTPISAPGTAYVKILLIESN